MTDLKGTVSLMLSEDYRERFIAEYRQVKIRRDKLRMMVDRWDAGLLEFTPTCSRDIYGFQLYVMEGYIDILRRRAEIEGIEL